MGEESQILPLTEYFIIEPQCCSDDLCSSGHLLLLATCIQPRFYLKQAKFISKKKPRAEQFRRVNAAG